MTGTAKPHDVWTGTSIRTCLHVSAGLRGRLTFEDLKVKDSSCAVDSVLLHAVQYNIELRIVPLYDSAFAEPPHDSRTFVKRAEHDGRSAVFVQVTDSLNAGACSIHVGDMIAIEDAQSRRWQSFGRQVDVVTGQRCRCNEEDLLFECPVTVVLGK